MGIFTNGQTHLLWQAEGETLRIEPWGENSLRVRSTAMGSLPEADWALLPPIPQQCAITINTGEACRATITNGKITAVVEEEGEAHRARVSFLNAQGKPLIRECSSGGMLKNKARNFQPMLGGDWRLTLSLESDPAEKLYGMGQYQQEIFDCKGCNFELAHRNSQASVPFVLSSMGYGFLWHNPAIGRASFGKNRTEWVAESTKALDYWVTAGDTPAEIITAYTGATGRPPMMPEYGLGFWQCKLRYWNQQQVLEVAREYKRRGLPIDVIVVDFFHWPQTGDFRYDEACFPDGAVMARELKEMGIELMVSVWPLIDYRSENFKEMLDKGYLVRPELGVNATMMGGTTGVFFDPTNPEAREYVWQKCKRNYFDGGVGLFWLDVAEPEYQTYDFANYRYHLGPNLQVGNVYPQLYSKAFYDGMHAEGREEIVNLVRCAWAGSQRYGALVWSGDIHSTWESFRRQICAGLHMGIAGIPWWTTDIGGFIGGNPDDPAFRELLVRWFQYGAFCPVMRLHGDREPISDNPFTGAGNEVWSFGEEAYGILSKYMNLRERLRPYTRALMREAHESGAPVMRTMFYEFPQDAACWDLMDQYLYGPDLLVAPIIEASATGRQVYLPAGACWTNLIDGKVYEGGQTVTVAVKLESMPVFARDGSHADLAGML